VLNAILDEIIYDLIKWFFCIGNFEAN